MTFGIHGMTDTLTKEQRSRAMSMVRSRDTRPEIAVRSVIHRLGYRFSLRRADLPGNPDIVLPKHKTVIFVHGCFWHRHEGCHRTSTPKSHAAYWQKKFERNVRRDRRAQARLRRMGWKTIIIWECEMEKQPARVKRRLSRALTEP